MNIEQNSQNMRDLEPLLVKAVQAVLSEPIPEDATERVVERAKRLSSETTVARPAAERSTVHNRVQRRYWAWSASGATALAASLLVALLLLSDNASKSFAKMLEAVSGRPWIHGTTTYTDGHRTNTSEYWVSNVDRTAAMKFGNEIRFEEITNGVSMVYDSKDGSVYRLPSLNGDKGRFAEWHLPGLLERVVTEPHGAQGLFHGERVVKAERHDEEGDGKQWREYSIQLERVGNPSLTRTVRVRLDLANQLPELWEERDANGMVATTRFDYPENGPKSIFELGVPQTAKVIDRVPKDELAQIIKAQRTAREQFDAYDTIVVESTEGTDTDYQNLLNLSVRRVRREGNKYRVDQLLAAKDAIQAPAADTDMRQWWKEHRDRFWSVPQLICDGRTVRFYKMRDGRIVPGAKPNLAVEMYNEEAVRIPTDDAPVDWTHLMPEHCSRPHLWASDKQREFSVDANANDGPAGAVRVTVTSNAAVRGGELYRYWLDPSKDFILQKETSTVFDRQTNQPAYKETQEFSEFAQSPSGKWYPQIVNRTTSDNPKLNTVTKFYVDFAAAIDAKLFQANAVE